MADPTLTGWWDFKNQRTLESRLGRGPTIDALRSGVATRVNSLGLIESVPVNVARFDFDPVT